MCIEGENKKRDFSCLPQLSDEVIRGMSCDMPEKKLRIEDDYIKIEKKVELSRHVART